MPSPAAAHWLAATHSLGQQRAFDQGESFKPRPSLPSPARLLSLLLTLCSCVSLLGTASALRVEVEAHGDRHRSAPLSTPDDSLDASIGAEILVVDTRPQPPVAQYLMPPLYGEDATAAHSTPPSKRQIETDQSSNETQFEIPKPFDTALSNNFTDTCANFFRKLLSDQEFNDCHPFSLMLETSTGFFDASRSYLRITQTLEATCAANSTKCASVMGGFARELVTEDACRVDYQNDNPQVLRAYNGLVAYAPLYQASCLKDDEGSYCFANAVTNSSATTDSYPYYLPVGAEMPGGTRPTCNSCLQDAMAIFASFAGNTTQPISRTYNTAAQQIAISCGTNFVNVTATPLKGAASTTATATLTPTISLFLMLLLFFFQ